MANMYNLNGLSYRPKENPEWFTRAMYGGRLVASGKIRVMMGIKGDELLSQIDIENKVLQIDGKDCAWTPNQIIKLSEKIAKVKTYKINLEQCIDELENKRTVYSLSPGATNEALPSELEDATLALIAIQLSNEIEEMIMGGDSSVNPNEFDGMVKLLLDATNSIKIVGATLTKANILQAAQDIYDKFPERVLQAEDTGDLLLYGSYASRRKIRNALADKTNQVLYPQWTLDETDKKNPVIYYLGMEFVPAKGIDDNTLIGITANNAYLLTDLLGDLEDIELGQFPKPMDNKVWIKGRLRLGFVIPFEDEAVIWSDKVTTAQDPAQPNTDLIVNPNSLVFDVAGETKTFKVTTADVAATITVNAAGSGFTVTKGTTTAGVTTVTVVAADATGSRDPKVGQVIVGITDTDRKATVTLNQRNDDGEINVTV